MSAVNSYTEDHAYFYGTELVPAAAASGTGRFAAGVNGGVVYTAPRASAASTAAPIERLEPELVELDLRGRLEDLASRRVQLFYYLALAYHKSGCTVKLGKSSFKLGLREKRGATGAYSCILPNIDDDYFKRLTEKIGKKGPSPLEEKRLLALGCAPKNIKAVLQKTGRDKMMKNLFNGVETSKLFTESCPFYTSMNTAVFLPPEIARFDEALERYLRPVIINLITLCSKHGLDPYEASQRFESTIKNFYNRSYKVFREKNRLLIDIDRLERELHCLELSYFCGDITDLKEFFCEYLRIAARYDTAQKRIRSLRFYSINIGLDCRMPEHHSLFKYTKTFYQDQSQHVERMTTQRELWDYIQGLQRKYEHIKNYTFCPLFNFNRVKYTSSVETLKSAVLKFCRSCKPVELYLASHTLQQRQITKFIKLLHDMDDWRPAGVCAESTSVENMISSISLQCSASTLPVLEQLSGKVKEGALIANSAEELEEQKIRH